jgi:hypothetical protein
MRTVPTSLAIAALFTAPAFAQTPDSHSPERTFFLNQATTPEDLTAMVTLLRTVADTPSISADPEGKALVSRGTADQMMLTDWLVHQLDQPAGSQTATPEYRMAGANGEVVRIFRLEPSATGADLTALVTAIRTIADAQRLFPYFSQRAVVVRASADRVDTAEWIFHQLSPAGQTPGVDSPAHHTPALGPNEGDDVVVQVFRLEPGTSNAMLTATITAIRTVADVQRVFSYEKSTAIVMRGSSERVAVAKWMVHQLAKPADASQAAATHEFQMQGLPDGTVRVYFLTHPGTAEDLASLVTQIRTTAGIQRIFPLSDYGAVTLRGRPEQIVTAGALVATFDASAR